MEKEVLIVSGCCFVCGNIMSENRCPATATSSSSEKPFFKYIESFVDCRFEETLFTCPQSTAEICEDCQKALEEYDSICLRAAKIQEQLSESFKRSQEKIQPNSKDELNCKICCAVFSSKKDMVDHDCTEDFAIEYVAFSDEDSNVKSITKLNAFKYTCNQCQEQFLRKSEYQIHMRIAHLPDDAEIFSCSLCPNAFISEVSLKLHFNLVHQANCTAFECPVCEKTFSTKNLLNRHFGIHNAQTERPHVCEICGKTYYHRSSFIEHTKCHSDQRDFACQYCHKTFRSISHLNRHKKIHTKQKNFECEICGSRFAERYNLTAHIKTHSGNGSRKKKQAST